MSASKPASFIAGTTEKQQKSNFTPRNGSALAHAWLAVSKTPIVGMDQKVETFYGTFSNSFNKIFNTGHATARTGRSARKRWVTVVKECSRVAGFIAQNKRNNSVGFNVDDFVRLAMAMYNSVKVSNAATDYRLVFKLLDQLNHLW